MRILILGAALLSFGASAQQLLEQVKGFAAASAVMAPAAFRSECESAAGQDQVGSLHCALREAAFQRGADFMSALMIQEATQGQLKTSDKLLRSKRFAEKAYDDCILRHADEVDRAGELVAVGPVCSLEKTDVYAGMEGFMRLYRQNR